jgi:hypothetical protein
MPLETQKNRTVWTWDETSKAALKELSAEGCSAAQIAADLSEKFGTPITKNAVIGARYRWAIAAGERKPRSPRRPKLHRSPEQPPHMKRGKQVPRPPLTIAIPFVDRAPGQCPFPVEGTGINMLCCGAKRYQFGGIGTNLKLTKFPYCWYHCNVAYRWRAPPVDERYVMYLSVR